MLYILSLLICVFAGIFSWNCIEPESFGQVLVFLLLWGFITSVGYWILGAIYESIK